MSQMHLLLLLFLVTSLTKVATLSDSSSNSLLRVPILRKSSRAHFLSSIISQRKNRSLDKRDPFQTSIYNDDGSQYLIQVGVGSPAQNFTVTLDTGSADLWVPSSSCPLNTCPLSRFNPKASSTYQDLNTPFSIEYGIGTVKGTYSNDTVTIAGAQIVKQQFGLASSTSDILPATTGGGVVPAPGQNSNKLTDNGILGLGYPSLTSAANSQRQNASYSRYNPVVFNMVQQKLITDPIFSIYMNKESEQGWVGEVIFGGVDQSKFRGDLVYLPVAPFKKSSPGSFPSTTQTDNNNNDYYYWMVYAQGIAVKNTGSDDTTYSLAGIGNNNDNNKHSLPTFILDTGSTLSYLPQPLAQSIISSVAGGIGGYQFDDRSQFYYIDCAQASSSATVELQMSQSDQVSSHPVTLSVPMSDLVIPLDGDTADKARLCMFGVAPMQGTSLGGSGKGFSNAIGSNTFVIGISILRSAYLVFDMGQNRVGLAAAIGLGGSVDDIPRLHSSSSSSSDSIRIEPLSFLLISLISFFFFFA